MTLNHRSKLSNKISKLFRSKSEQGLKVSPQQSPNGSPKNSPRGPPKRRLLRIVRDNEQAGEEWENPHLVRRYTEGYWEQQMEEARALQHSVSLPYDVNSDHTILKKATSTESDNDDASSPTLANKRASFKEEVQVIEFCGGERIAKRSHYMHAVKLVDSEDEVFITETELIETDFKTCEKRQRRCEFQLAKQNSFEEDYEEAVENSENMCSDCVNREIESDISVVDTVSDSGAMSDTSGCCSDSEQSKKKHKTKKVRFPVTFSDLSNDSDKENEQLQSHPVKPKSYSKTISKLLRSVHLEKYREHEAVCKMNEH